MCGLASPSRRCASGSTPPASDTLSALYTRTVDAYWGDAITRDDRTAWSWARIPHFYQSPCYVYQYATCMASTAALI